MRRRQVRETLRSVYRVGNHLVKTFEYPEGAKPHSRPWERERAALLRLYGEKAEAETGIFERTEAGMHRVCFVRPFVEGTTVETFAREEMPAVAALMADLHARGVVTDDANAGNFLRTPGGRLVFMDFGRARIYRGQAPAWMVGKEIAKLFREGFAYDWPAGRHFWRAYLSAARPNPFRRALLETSWRTAILFRNLRKGRGR